MDAQTLTRYALNEILKNYFVKGTELEPYRTGCRFDVFGLRRSNREIRVLEIKSGRKDFLADKKWQKYLRYCTYFAFVAPKGAISPEELPPKVGLIEVYEDDKGLTHQYTVKCRKLHDVGDREYIKFLEALAARGYKGQLD